MVVDVDESFAYDIRRDNVAPLCAMLNDATGDSEYFLHLAYGYLSYIQIG